MTDQNVSVPTGGVSLTTPKKIEAHSKSRDSFARIIILGLLLGFLCLALITALFIKEEVAKDILLVISGVAGYLAGGASSERKSDT